MKHLFKALVICGLFAMISGLTTSCVNDPEMGPPVFEITGNLEVKTGDGFKTPAIYATLPVTSENIPKIFYIVRELEEGTEPAAKPRRQEIQFEGKEISGKTSELRITSDDDKLRRGKRYGFYFIVAINNMNFLNEDIDPVFAYEFTTPETYTSTNEDGTPGEPVELMTLSRSYEGVEVEVFFPEKLRQREHDTRIKWGVTNLAHYNMYKYMYGQIDIDFIHRNENMYPAIIISNDTILDISHQNAYRMSEKYPGEIGYYYADYDDNSNPIIVEVPSTDPLVEAGTATPIQYYYLPAPGEPLVLLMSECRWSDCDLGDYEDKENAGHKIETCPKVHPTINFTWGAGWYKYPFDYNGYAGAGFDGPLSTRYPILGGGSVNEEDYWDEDAWHKNVQIITKQPEPFNGTVKVDTSKLTPDSGLITLTPSKEVYAYSAAIFPMTGYEGESFNSITELYLSGDRNLWQWFSTSELGMYFGFVPYYNDSADGKPVVTEIQLEDKYYLEAGMRYILVLTAVGYKVEDGVKYPDLSAQKFVTKVFKIPEYTKDAPELIVTPYDSYDPYKVKFNIKNPNYKKNKVLQVAYAANYKREFDSYMSQEGASLSSLVSSNASYTMLDAASVAEVNSKDGYDMEFTYLRDGQEFTVAVMGWNDESRPSNPDAEGSQAVATASTKTAPAAEKCDMDKLNSLKGTWTATATIREYDFINETVLADKEVSWKVNIGDLTSKSALTEEDYVLGESLKMKREDIDKQFVEFKEQEKVFNEITLNQNRVLCQGWTIDSDPNLALTSPWDLWFHNKYGAAQISYLFNDFGPKWFLQTNKKGDVFVPVNYLLVPPLTRWYNASDHYLVSGNFEHGYASYVGSDWMSVEEVRIPVSMSEDGNTITLKSTTIEYENTDEETGTKEKVVCYGYPNIMYNSSSGPAFFNPYIVSEVVLTRGWTEPEVTPEVQLARLYSSRAAAKKGKQIINSADYVAPKKTYSITPFTVSVEGGEVQHATYKILTRDEILNNFKEGKKPANYIGARRK